MYRHYLSRLEDAIRQNWESPALCNYKGEEFTFEQLAVYIEKLHIFFEGAGVKRGDKIAICAKNSARWALSFLAVNTYGAVVVPVLSDFLPSTVASLVAHSDSIMLITDRDIWSKIDPESLPGLKAVVNCSDFTLLQCQDASVKSSFDGISASFDQKYPLGFSRDHVNYFKDNYMDLAVINYTSGTTSAPKGVMLRYECFSAMVDFAVSRVKCGSEDSVVSMLPMGHIYGLAFEFLFPICCGVRIYYFGKTPSPSLLLKAMSEVKPFMVVTVPLVMEKIYKNSIKPLVGRWYMKLLLGIPVVGGAIYRKMGAKLQEAFGSRVRHFIMGGAALNPTVEKCFSKMRLPYTVGYGMTEAAPLLGYEDWKEYVPGSCGKPVACTEVRIDSDDPQHVAGEILAKGANICSGYYKNPQASENAFTEDGFLRTGDLGVMDRNGNIFIKGRCKTMILSANGQNIYPEELEAIINAEPYVAESVVVDRSGKLVALVFLDQAAIKRDSLDEEAVSDIPESIRLNSNRQLPAYSRITKVEIVTEPFEKTPKMSIKRFLYK